MKDYSLGLDSHFILRYEVDKENNKIIIHYNDGTTTLEYTKELELKLLDEMKNQVIKLHNFENRMEEHIKMRKSFASIEYVLSFFITLFSLSNPNVFSGVGIGIGVGAGLRFSGEALENYFLLKDYRKNILFLKHEDKINEYLESQVNHVIEISDDQPLSLNINDIDNMKYKQVKKLVNKAYGLE